MRAGPRRSTQRGAILVKFALLSFGFFAIAALVIDMRIASWTQQQMQVATDSACIEGMRWRDQLGPTPARIQAATRVEYAFDDDLDPASGDAYDYGAGPNTFVRDTTAQGALGVVEIPDDRVYDPVLELNVPNAQHGDMVLGEFDESDPDNDEFSDYGRTDFTPSAADPASQLAAEAFLVRLRRTPNLFGLDDDPGISSSAPSLPLLWGRGSLIKGADGSGQYNARNSGITVRSTSIASSRRVLEVATPGPGFDTPDGAPYVALQRFGIRSDPTASVSVPPGQVVSQFTPGLGGTLPPGHGGIPPGLLAPPPSPGGEGPPGVWENLAVGGTIELTVRADGSIRSYDYVDPSAGLVRGGIWGYFAEVTGEPDEVVRVVGELTSPHAPTTIPEARSLIPLLRDVGGVERVIGFGRVEIKGVSTETPDPSDPPSVQVVATFFMEKLAGAIVPAGATAISSEALANLSANPALRTAHAQFEEPAMAPVLTR